MKKILIIILVVFTLFITACSMNYEKRFNELLNLELEEVFETKEEMIEFFERVQANYDNSEYINYSGELKNFMPSYENEINEYSYYEQYMKLKFQAKEQKLEGEIKELYKFTDNKKDDIVIDSTFYEQIEENKILKTYIDDRINEKKYYISQPYNNLRNRLYERILISYISIKSIPNNVSFKTFGKNSNGEYIAICENEREDGFKFIEVYTIKDEMFVGFEMITFYKGEKVRYVKEEYSFEKNTIDYPDFKDYKPSFGL